MDTDKVIQDLNRRFAAPLPEFYKRRIIFWYDEDREFEDKLEDIEIADAKPEIVVNDAVKNIIKAVNAENGAKLIGANSDVSGPIENGIAPACGALVAPIEMATGNRKTAPLKQCCF